MKVIPFNYNDYILSSSPFIRFFVNFEKLTMKIFNRCANTNS